MTTIEDFFKEEPKSVIELYWIDKQNRFPPQIQQAEDKFKDALLSKFWPWALDENLHK